MGLKKTVFGRQKYKVNTFIGGVSSVWSTPPLLASRLGISVNRVKSFNIIGNDIQCAIIGGSYQIPTNFCDVVKTIITYYLDPDGLVNGLGQGCFRETSQITEIDFNGVLSINSEISRYSSITKYVLNNCISLANVAFGNTLANQSITIIAPKCTSLGTTLSDNSVFCKWWKNVKWNITVNIFLQTVNMGAPDGDLIGLNAGSIVNYV